DNQPDASEPKMFARPISAIVQPPIAGDRPRSIRYGGRCTVMKASWNPQVKNPTTRSTYERWANASPSAWRIDCRGGEYARTPSGFVPRVISAVESGSTSSIDNAKRYSVSCHPLPVISAALAGANAN